MVETKVPSPDRWKPTFEEAEVEGNEYSANHVIDAYTQGKAAGLDEVLSKLMQKLHKDTVFLADLVDQLIERSKEELGIEILDAFLKVESTDTYRLLLGVSEEDFLSGNILELYGILTDLENAHEGDALKFSFSLVDVSDGFDLELVYADGYYRKAIVVKS